MGIRSMLRKVFGRDREESPATSVPPQSRETPTPDTPEAAARRAADDLVAASFDNPQIPRARAKTPAAGTKAAAAGAGTESDTAKTAAPAETTPEPTEPEGSDSATAESTEPEGSDSATASAAPEGSDSAAASTEAETETATDEEPVAAAEPAAETQDTTKAEEPVEADTATAEADTAAETPDTTKAEEPAEADTATAEAETAVETPDTAKAEEPAEADTATAEAEADAAEPAEAKTATAEVAADESGEPTEPVPDESATATEAADTDAEAADTTEPSAEADADATVEPEAEASEADVAPEPEADGAVEPEAQADTTPEPEADTAVEPEAQADADADAPQGSVLALPAVKAAAPHLADAYKAAGAQLKKQGLVGARAAVYLVVDRSGSMRGYFKDGSVQRLAEQVTALAAHLDEDATVTTVFFSTDIDGTVDLTPGDLTPTRVEEINGTLGRLGRTNYHRAVEEVLAHHGKADPSRPALVVFQTDGAPESKTAATQALSEAEGRPLHWRFVAWGEEDNKAFDFLRKLDGTPRTATYFPGATPVETSHAAFYGGVLAGLEL
ncbi:VWA domain-containing protein [Streptomyces sp. NPDC058700]|uniref:VWA domain-containing protein n=1 Tax=Streptomyces sp. NPDC058700 TaxID=3346607 RepID=UPI0036656093